jgi:hypothetical protein
MTSGFISYTHRDAELKDQLVRHLAPLRREGLIHVWHDAMLRPGEHLDDTVQAALAASDLILLLVSSDFIHSEYCYEQEMVRAFARQRAGTARVVSIILRPCQWKGVPVGDGQTLQEFVALPQDGLPVTSWSDPDAAFDNATGAIREMLRKPVAGPTAGRAATDPVVAPPGLVAAPIRSNASILGIAAKPTDLDRDRFLRSGFAAAVSLFERKLAELKESDGRVETDFERIDSRSFAASVYLDGKRIGQVSIWYGSDVWRNALCLSYDTTGGARNSMNDWLPVEETADGLAFSPGNPMSRAHVQGPLDAEAAATYLWGSFLEQVRSRIRI